MFSKLSYEVKNNVAWITLNSEKNLNAFDEKMDSGVVDALRLCESDSEVKAVVLCGAGRAFSAGGDIGAMYKNIKEGKTDFNDEITKISGVTLGIKRLSKPVIAAVHGVVAGAAFNITLACDYCIATENATFIQAFINIGLIPDAGGLFLLTRAVGINKAMELAITGRPVSSKEAKELGFVAEIVKEEDLNHRASKLAAKFVAGPKTAYRELKRLMWESQFTDMPRYLEEEIKGQSRCGEVDDFKEGVSAFVEKRPAKYK